MSKRNKNQNIQEEVNGLVEELVFIHVLKANRNVSMIPIKKIAKIVFQPTMQNNHCIGAEIIIMVDSMPENLSTETLFIKDILIATAFACALKQKVSRFYE